MKRKKKASEFNKCQNTILSFDLFARQVQLTFEGKEKFKTGVGFFFTLVFIALISGYGYYAFIPILTDEKTEMGSN